MLRKKILDISQDVFFDQSLSLSLSQTHSTWWLILPSSGLTVMRTNWSLHQSTTTRLEPCFFVGVVSTFITFTACHCGSYDSQETEVWEKSAAGYMWRIGVTNWARSTHTLPKHFPFSPEHHSPGQHRQNLFFLHHQEFLRFTCKVFYITTTNICTDLFTYRPIPTRSGIQTLKQLIYCTSNESMCSG